jgi:hypothetical protein
MIVPIVMVFGAFCAGLVFGFGFAAIAHDARSNAGPVADDVIDAIPDASGTFQPARRVYRYRRR